MVVCRPARRVEIGGDGADGHVHVGGRVAGNERATASGTIIARATDASGEVVAHRAHRVRTRQVPLRDVRRELQPARTGVVLPVNYLIIRALPQYDQFSAPTSPSNTPTRSGRQLTPRAIAGASPTGSSPSGSPDPTAGDPSTAPSTACTPTRGGRDTLLCHETCKATTAAAGARDYASAV